MENSNIFECNYPDGDETPTLQLLGEIQGSYTHLLLQSVWGLSGPVDTTDAVIYMTGMYQAKQKEVDALKAMLEAKQESAKNNKRLLDQYAKLNDSCIASLAISESVIAEHERVCQRGHEAIQKLNDRIELGCQQYAELAQKYEMAEASRKEEIEKREKERHASIKLMEASTDLRLQHEKVCDELAHIRQTYQRHVDESHAREFVQINRIAQLNALRKRQGPDVCPDSLRHKLYVLAHHMCMMCKATNNLSIDRRWPGSRGGKYVPTNCGVLCNACNASKGDSVKKEWWYWTWPEHQLFVEGCEILETEANRQMDMSFADDSDSEYEWGTPTDEN